MFKNATQFVLAIVLMSAASGSTASIATSGSVFLHADPGSYVGGGIGAPEVTWTHGVEGIFFVNRNFDKGISVSFDDGNFWSFDFAAPTYNPITNTNDGNDLVIKFYNHATRFPFNSPTRPGLSFDGNGRGNNTLGGWFDVLEASFSPSGDVQAFAVDFRQFDESESMTGPSTYGSLRINSAKPLNLTDLHPVPIPAAGWLLASGLIVIARRNSAERP